MRILLISHSEKKEPQEDHHSILDFNFGLRMRILKYMFHAYIPVGFNLLRGCSCSSNTMPCVKSSRSKMMMVQAPWDKLIIDVLGLIFERLDLEDRIRFLLVCKQWRGITKQTPHNLWLMLPYEPNCRYLSFFDINKGKVRKLNLPESAQLGWFSGGSEGWLFLAIGSNIYNLRVFLFDPISRAQIPLPPLSTISTFEDKLNAKHSDCNPAACIIYEVQVSSSDAALCIVAATLIPNDKLALCRPHDERWTIIEGLLPDGYAYGKFMFFHGELYVCIIKTDDAEPRNIDQPPLQTHSITLGSHRVNLKLIYSTPRPTHLFHAEYADGMIEYYKDCFLWPYLVESNGQLLLVNQIYDTIITRDEEDWDGDLLLLYNRAATFQVSKIETTIDDTLCITRLTDLGNQSLFLGNGGCFAVENSNEFEKNCIYFLQVYGYSRDHGYPLVCREAGVYYVDNRSIKRCFPSVKLEKFNSFMHWLSPNIRYGVSG